LASYGNDSGMVGEKGMSGIARCTLEWCNAWREGDICSWGWDMSKDEPFECRHPRGSINVVDEKEVRINEDAEV